MENTLIDMKLSLSRLTFDMKTLTNYKDFLKAAS
jgi:hypothetical protein